MNKKIVLLLTCVLVFGLGCEKVEQESVKDLPWMVNADDVMETRVLSLGVGKDSLATVTEVVRKIPEIVAFQSQDGSYLIEAYFPRVKQGPLQGSLVVEVDVKDVDLTGYAKFDKPGKPMPSGKRKFVLSKTGLIGANKLRVWKLAYMPATNYTEDLLEKYFGKPESKAEVNAMLENWFYPSKSLLITFDKEGREVFYYSARQEYQRLLDSVQQLQNKND